MLTIFTILSVAFLLIIAIAIAGIVISIKYECWPGLVGGGIITLISIASLSESVDPYIQYRYLLEHKPVCSEHEVKCINRNIEWLEDSIMLITKIDALKDEEQADYILAKSKLDSLRNLPIKEQ